MSKLVERGLRRQRAIQQSRGTAWILLAVVLPIALLAVISLLVSVADGRVFSLSGFVSGLVSGLVAISAMWVAGHLFREARRLGKLLKDPEFIMRSEHDPDLVTGVHWSSLNPFSGWRN